LLIDILDVCHNLMAKMMMVAEEQTITHNCFSILVIILTASTYSSGILACLWPTCFGLIHCTED